MFLTALIVMTAFMIGICAIFLFGRMWGMDRLAEKFPLRGISMEILKARDYYWGSKGTLLATLGISFFGHFGCITIFYGVGLSLGATELGYTDYITAIPTISFVSCLSAMGLGVGELSSKWLLTAKGMSEQVAVAISLLYRAALFAWSLLGGLVALFYKSK